MKNTHAIFKKGQAAVELAIFGSIILLAFSILLMYGQRLDSQQQVKMESFRRALQKAYERNSSVSYTLKKEGRSFNLFGGFGQGQPSTVASTASVLWQKGMSGPQPVGGAKAKQESYAYYVINDNEIGGQADGTGLPRYPKQQRNLMGQDVTVWVTPSVYSEEGVRTEEYNSAVKKEESPGGGIVNTRSADLKDTITTTLHVRVDTSYDSDPHDKVTPSPQYKYEGETYTDEDEGPQTIQSIPAISLGAYVRDDINRIDYSPDRIDTTIHRERTWQTGN